MTRHVMLEGPEATEAAARADLAEALDAARCATILLLQRRLDPCERELARATLRALARAHHAAHHVARPPCPPCPPRPPWPPWPPWPPRPPRPP